MSPRLFLSVWSIETRKLMSYRVDFWVNALLAAMIELALAYYLWRAIFEVAGRDEIDGFTFQGMVLYYVMAILVGKLIRGQERAMNISRDIYDGSLTRFLIYPAPYFAFKYAEHLGALVPAIVQTAVFGLIAALMFDLPSDTQITGASVLMAVGSMIVGNFLFFVMRYPVQGIAFWADNVWSLNVMLRLSSELFGGFMLPLSLFPSGLQRVLELSPFPYLFYVPVMTLIGRVSPAEWGRGLGVAFVWCGIFAVLSIWVWKRGFRTYTGVGI